MAVASASQSVSNMNLDSVVQQCILVSPGTRRFPSERHLLAILRQFFKRATHSFSFERMDWMFEAVIQLFHLYGDVVPGETRGVLSSSVAHGSREAEIGDQ